MHSKIVSKIISVSLALFVAAVLFPGVVKSVHAKTDLDLGTDRTDVDLENVPLDTPTDITFIVANNNDTETLSLSLFLVSPEDSDCIVQVNSPAVVVEANDSEELVVTYQTSTTEQCSGEYLVYWFGPEISENGSSGFHTIAVVGTGEEANANPNIVIGAFDTGILDREWEDRYISAWIEEYAQSARNHWDFVKDVFLLTKKLKKEGLITKEEKHIIRRYAHKANIPSIAIEVSEQGTIMIGGRDTKIDDRTYDGYLISEWLNECSGDAYTHGQFVSCVSQLMKNMKKENLITRRDKRVIRRHVAKAKYKGRRCKK
jgi:hypothetical protein